MGSRWCGENLRDIQAWRQEGFPLGQMSSNEAAKLFDAGVRQFVAHTDYEQLGGIVATAKAMVAAEPDSLMARVFQLGLDAQGLARSPHRDAAFEAALVRLVADANGPGVSKWERNHALAVDLYAHGHLRSAAVQWEAILGEHPADLFALKCAQNAYIFVNDPMALQDVAARVVDHQQQHTKMDPIAESYVAGMHAFGLEECRHYQRASAEAERALSLNPLEAWATHARAHCYEMAGDHLGGTRFMEATEHQWTRANMVAGHNWWHAALFHHARDDHEAVLAIFDDKIATHQRAHSVFTLFDGASLLARLELDSGFTSTMGRDRWRSLLPLVSAHVDDHCTAFGDCHQALVLAFATADPPPLPPAAESDGEGGERGGGGQQIDQYLDSIKQFVGSNAAGDTVQIMRAVGAPLCEAIAAYAGERYAQAFDTLFPLRSQLGRVGGSRAQADVFTQLLVAAGLHCCCFSDASAWDNGRRREQTLLVLAERERLFPGSAIGARLLDQHRRRAENE